MYTLHINGKTYEAEQDKKLLPYLRDVYGTGGRREDESLWWSQRGGLYLQDKFGQQ